MKVFVINAFVCRKLCVFIVSWWLEATVCQQQEIYSTVVFLSSFLQRRLELSSVEETKMRWAGHILAAGDIDLN